MPELPEVETVRRGLAPVMEGVAIARLEQRRKDLRFAFPDRFATRLEGARIMALGRRAKYLTAALDTGETLIMHLGMSGSFRIAAPTDETAPGIFHRERGAPGPHDHVVFHMQGGAQITYNDPRRFGFMLLTPTGDLEAHPLIAGLGIEPLGNALNAEFLNTALAGKTASLKAALLDQRIVAGLGNIYVCEALHRAGLAPTRKAHSVTRKKAPPEALDRLARAIRDVLGEAIVAGGSSLRDHRQTNGELGYFQHAFRVYDREDEACATPSCHGTVRRIVQQGRSSFYCPKCQA